MQHDALGFLARRADLAAPAGSEDYCRRRSQGFCEGCGDLTPDTSHLRDVGMLCDPCHRQPREAATRLAAVEDAITRGRLRLVTAAILFDEEGRLFLARRGPKAFLAGLWEFPGGKADPGEALDACLARELEEELRCRPRSLAPLAMVDHPYPEADLWIRLVGFTGLAEPASIHPVEHDAVAWVRRGELDSFVLAPADIPLARRIRDRVVA